MRNLYLWQVYSKLDFYPSQEKFCVCYSHHEESKLGQFFTCSHSLVVSNVDSDGEIMWTKDLSEIASPENKPINITFLSLVNLVSVGLANGELFTLSNSGSDCDLVGVCDNGLLEMEWSPDQELLVLVTNDFKVILMSCTFDPIKESYLLTDDFGEKQFITVGWGKKETQFHGSEGKQARVKTEVPTNMETSNKVIISWRGDGSLFAVAFAMEGIRRFKIFDREGNLQFTSEKQHGLEANLSWRPSGNLIATTQKQNDKHLVSFFEKNGLKHGEFVIPIASTTIVEDLLWSSDSEILTILCRNVSEDIYKVLLFTTSNYHWYQKQTLVFKESVNKIMWDNDFEVANNKKLHILLQDGHYYSYTWIWNVDHSKGKTKNDNAVVTVIDGKKILISAFRYAIVPPPMAHLEIEVNSEINSVQFAPENVNDLNLNSNTFVVITTNSLVFIEQTNKDLLQYEITKTVPFNENVFPFQHYNWHWLDYNTFLCVKVASNNCYELIQYKISDGILMKEHVLSLPSGVTRVHSHPSISFIVFLQLDSGEILQYCSDGTVTPQEISFPEACPKFCVLSADNDVYFLGLSHKGYLYLMDVMVMNNVSSFFVHTGYLLLTTLKHVLLCVELTKVGLSSIESFDKTEKSDIYKRKIERGAKLVIAVPQDTRTIFQMPRGNLETIQPRPLSLKIIGEYLDTLKYYEAFDLMRKQRINLNLIYDHNPKLFKENIDVFLNTIKNNSWLSLFLSDLENVDVTKTMYSSSYTGRDNVSENILQNKVHFVCDLVKLHLTKSSDSADRVLPLLTTYVKKNTVNDLEEALILIKELKKQESVGNKKLPVTSDEALKYLLYMVNVENLFDVALGMYDFDLVLLVANKSQKDPKEYISMLNELNEMDENYKKFTINKHLKRFDRAVQCLAKSGPNKYGELRTFVKYHSLYRTALALFSAEEEIYKQISDDFGSYLKLKKQLIEAGIIYERAGSIDKAIECYKEALEWELALKLAQSKPREEFKKLSWEIATTLKEEKRFKEALVILEQFSEESEDVIIFAIESGQYKTAMKLCAKFNHLDFIDKKLLPSLLEEYNSLKDLLETNWNNFIKYRNRLQIVREIKSKKAMEECETPYVNKDNDLYSDAGSTIASSSGSGRSYRSSKNRRKHERKVASLKEGSQYEDTALVLALHSIVTSTFELRLHVKDINIALSCLSRDDEALILQSSLERLLKEMKDSLKCIWSNAFTLEATNAAIAAENVPEGYSVIPQGIATLENGGEEVDEVMSHLTRGGEGS
ncbi:unnamed protein product [Euphydryas editha]|uniref:Elongator complex protein 1 n=1 Tax=Euphydryas editha TaxID=104508 RepID=A0AAU9TIZ6_EUPED|nr:unnamed protein product [Euphydryas editha]